MAPTGPSQCRGVGGRGVEGGVCQAVKKQQGEHNVTEQSTCIPTSNAPDKQSYF